jgi:hypothetical protein
MINGKDGEVVKLGDIGELEGSHSESFLFSRGGSNILIRVLYTVLESE